MTESAQLLAAQESRLRQGEIQPVDLVDFIYKQITAYPDPAVWIHLRPQEEVLREAQALAGKSDLPLYGLPFAVKDNIDVLGCPTTAACPAYQYWPKEEASVVTRLKEAGALCLGKTNLDQFATGLVGVRSPYGACRNVYDPRYISGGSSSGSAVAVAAGLASFALGTDTAGSGRIPAAFNNLVGWKPTRGRLSTKGVVPACRSLDCVSLLARSVKDAERIFQVVEGFDPADPYSREKVPERSPLPDGKTFRFGVPRNEDLNFFGNRAAETLYAEAVKSYTERGGAEIRFDLTPFRKVAELLYEGPWVAERLQAAGSLLRDQPEALLPVIRTILEKGKTFDAFQTFQAMDQLQTLRAQTLPFWKTMDFMLLPTAGTAYTIEEVEKDPIRLNSNLGYYTNFVNLLDLCALAVPAGFQPDGLPFGVTLVAPAWKDEALAFWAK